MKKAIVVVDMQNDFVDGALGTAEAQAMTSCTNGSPMRWAMPMPAEPVSANENFASPTTSLSCARFSCSALPISEKWRA